MKDIEKYLSKYRTLEIQMKELRERREEIKKELNNECANNITRALRHAVVQTSAISNPVLDTVIRLANGLAKEAEKILRRIDELEREQTRIFDTVGMAGLSYEEYRYIKLRYFDGISVEDVEKKIQYSDRQTLRIKNEALKKISKILKDGG